MGRGFVDRWVMVRVGWVMVQVGWVMVRVGWVMVEVQDGVHCTCSACASSLAIA